MIGHTLSNSISQVVPFSASITLSTSHICGAILDPVVVRHRRFAFSLRDLGSILLAFYQSSGLITSR